MDKIAKVFVSAPDLKKSGLTHTLLESYDAFQLISAPPATIKKLSAQYPLAEITGDYNLELQKPINTAKPRILSTGKVAAHPAYKNAPTLKPGPHHYIVQFIGPIKKEWLSAVKKAGGTLREPYGSFAYIVLADKTSLAKIAKLPKVRWVGHLPFSERVKEGAGVSDTAKPAGVIDPQIGSGTTMLAGQVAVRFFDRASMIKAVAPLEKLGVKILATVASNYSKIVELPEKNRKQIVEAISKIHGVREIAPVPVPAIRNNVAPKFMGAVKFPQAPGNPALDGSGEIVGIADTGLDTGDATTVRADFAGRVKKIFSWRINDAYDTLLTNPGADDGPADVDSGHGTHVAGSVLGGGSPGAGGSQTIRGLAHGAQLVFQAVEQHMKFIDDDARAAARVKAGEDPFLLTGIPDDLTKLFQQAYDAGARLHSNSWGGGKFQAYDEQSKAVDQFVWDNKDFCVFFSSGNDGQDLHPKDGVVDKGSITPPATAKNCITVGATESERLEGIREIIYGNLQGGKFTKAPLKSEIMGKDPTKMAPFSSRGPTKDKRTKPDVVAPGTFILSTRSTQLPAAEVGFGLYTENHAYMYDSGTSMATPLTAGAVTVLRQFFRVKQGVAKPTAALLKAAVICGATRLTGTAPAGTLFDNHQGYGRVNIDAIVSTAAPTVLGFSDESRGLEAGKFRELTVVVKDNSVPLRVTLVYSDFPGDHLVNDLNLILIAPDGKRHTGNGTGNNLDLDTTNNVEVVSVDNPMLGSWIIQVVASDIKHGPQDYALVWLGGL